MRAALRLGLPLMLIAALGACSSDGDETPADAPTGNDRAVYAAASSLRICGAASSGLAAAAQDLADYVADGDDQDLTPQADALAQQGEQVESTSKAGSERLETSAPTDATTETREQGLALFGRCTVVGTRAQEAAALAEASDVDEGALADAASAVAEEAQGVANDVESYVNELPKP